MKRSLFVLFALVACNDRGSDGGVTMCENASKGAICTARFPCVMLNDFSSCESSTCEYTGGRYHY